MLLWKQKLLAFPDNLAGARKLFQDASGVQNSWNNAIQRIVRKLIPTRPLGGPGLPDRVREELKRVERGT